MEGQFYQSALSGAMSTASQGNRGVLSAAATGLTNFIAAQGGDADSVLGVSGINPEQLASPTLSLSLVNYCEVLEVAARNSGVGNFGLYYGKQFKPQSLGLIGYIGLSSATAKQALLNVANDFHWHQHDTLTQVVDMGECLRIDYQVRHGAIVNRRQDAELTIGMFLNLIRSALGPKWSPREVHFEHPQPEQWHEHCKVFNAPVWFEQSYNSMVIPKRDLVQPMPHQDPMLLLLLRETLRRLNRKTSDQNIAERTAAQIRIQLTQGEPDLEEIARNLGVSRETLQRHLRSEGSNFTQLIDNVRRALAANYLKERHLSVTEMALLLGYSEISAFSRAFRRWFGVSPRQWLKNAPYN